MYIALPNPNCPFNFVNDIYGVKMMDDKAYRFCHLKK
jgi:hypothetical protein